jgi:hypothetical protein
MCQKEGSGNEVGERDNRIERGNETINLRQRSGREGKQNDQSEEQNCRPGKCHPRLPQRRR